MTVKIATVIGGRGFIGSALTAELEAQGWLCQIVGRGDSPLQYSKLGVVFYCAGHTADYLKDPAATVTSHITVLADILFAREFEKLVYCSSTRLYDDLPPSQLADESAILPIDALKPRHFYDLTKLTGESLCHVATQSGVHVVRLSSVYSEAVGSDGFLGPLLRLAGVAKKGDAIEVASSPNISRDYIHLSDVVHGLIAIAEMGLSPVYNLASGVSLRNADLAQILKKRIDIELIFTDNQRARAYAQIDISLLQQELGVFPSTVETSLDPWLTATSERRA